MPTQKLPVVLVVAAALVALIAASGKSALLLADGSVVVGWEQWVDQKWVEGQKEPGSLVLRGGGEGKHTPGQRGGEEGLGQTDCASSGQGL